MGRPRLDLVGQRFGRLRVESLSRVVNGCTRWMCICDCGNRKEAHASNLKLGGIRSCGCLLGDVKRAQPIYKLRRDHPSEYWAWSSMRSRCSDPNAKAFSRYGGRGITVCQRWNSFASFLDDMGPKPNGQRLTLEREDNNGNYEPGNCKWATYKEQANNRSTSVSVSFSGKTLTIRDWAKDLGVPFAALYARRAAGWPVEKMLTEPIRQRGRA